MLIRALLAAFALALLAPTAAHAGGFQVSGSTVIYTAGAGDVDQIAAFETPTTIRFTRFGGAAVGPGPGCSFVGNDPDTIDCSKTGVTSLKLDLGDGDDVASVSPALTLTATLNGGDGRDGLFGGGGLDVFDGGPGDDNIVSRDARGEQVQCGSGRDTAISDDADTRLSCEEVEGDADGDGVRRPADCDDTNPALRPGATDVPENGIDEDCSGLDAVITDRDGDGSPRPQDCDDTAAKIRPGAREAIGNDVDENCDGRIDPFPPLTGILRTRWRPDGAGTRNLTLLARKFPSNTVITLRCSACPRKTVTRTGRTVNLRTLLGRRVFPRRARIEVQITHARRIGRVVRFRMDKPGLPQVEFLCLPPGGAAGPC